MRNPEFIIDKFLMSQLMTGFNKKEKQLFLLSKNWSIQILVDSNYRIPIEIWFFQYA